MTEELVKFDFHDPGISHEEILKEEQKKGGKPLELGLQELTITKPELLGRCPNDETWLSIKMILEGSNGGSKYYWVQVPTGSVLFNPEHSNGPTRVFSNLREFIAGLGEDLKATKESLSKVIPKYFSNLKKLDGLKLKCFVGYTGPHANWVGKDQYTLVDKDDTPLTGEIYEKRSDVERACAELKLTNFQQFAEILYIESKLKAPSKKASTKKPVAKKAPEVEVPETPVVGDDFNNIEF